MGAAGAAKGGCSFWNPLPSNPSPQVAGVLSALVGAVGRALQLSRRHALPLRLDVTEARAAAAESAGMFDEDEGGGEERAPAAGEDAGAGAGSGGGGAATGAAGASPGEAAGEGEAVELPRLEVALLLSELQTRLNLRPEVRGGGGGGCGACACTTERASPQPSPAAPAGRGDAAVLLRAHAARRHRAGPLRVSAVWEFGSGEPMFITPTPPTTHHHPHPIPQCRGHHLHAAPVTRRPAWRGHARGPRAHARRVRRHRRARAERRSCAGTGARRRGRCRRGGHATRAALRWADGARAAR